MLKLSKFFIGLGMFVLIAYDISNDKDRRKIEKLLSSYGNRVNYSLFEVEIESGKLSKLKEKLIKHMKEEDSVRFYFLDKLSIQKSYDLNKKRPIPFYKSENYVF
ncbi:MAG TPA: CRISPR-associated endonuclease Cas2 [Sulfurospirillum arcachonense]|nr:CRISPR-associated endonuclease Cas2 [Sulfurospirillum arcachonense]